jgi:hypothetical protein
MPGASSAALSRGNRGGGGEPGAVADLPEFLTLKKNRDRTERVELVFRRAFFGVLTLLGVLALLNVFGQRPTTTIAGSPAAELEVFAPSALRGGIYYEGRFTIRAREAIENATLVFDGGWTEQLQINTIEPSPVGESSRDGRLALDFGHLAAGRKLVVFLQYQVNPTNVGRRSQDVELHDGETFLAEADRTLTIFP